MTTSNPTPATKRWKILLIIGLSLVPLALLLVYYFQDEPLRPEVKQKLEWKPDPKAFDDNGYLVLLGQAAPETGDAHELGKQLLQAQLKLFDQNRPQKDWQDLAEKMRDKKQDRYREQLCQYQKNHCVSYYLQQRTVMNAILADSAMQQKRFAAIFNARNFTEVALPVVHAPIAWWSYIVNGAELSRVRAIYETTDGRAQEGVRHLAETARFSRAVLRQSSTLLSHMIAIAMIHRDMRILGELVQAYPALAKTHERELMEIARPVSVSEFSFKKALAYEEVMRLITFNRLLQGEDEEGDKWWFKYLYRRNTTLNKVSRWDVRIQEIAEVPADRLDAAWAEIEEASKKEMDINGMWSDIGNFVGNVLANISFPSFYISYFQRQHDIDGYARLVGLQVKLKAAGTPPDKIPEAINAAGDAFFDPYTRKPMEWDAASGQLRFQGRQRATHNLNGNNLFTVAFK